MKKTDTRVQFTKSRLQEALLSLLQEKPVDRVTVRELCDRAELNRSTFYLHYTCPYDLLSELEQAFVEAHRKLFLAFWQQGRNLDIMAELFACLRENRDFFCAIMGPYGDPAFTEKLVADAREGILDQWQLEFPAYAREKLDYIFDFVLTGSLRLILNWLNDDKGLSATEFSHRMERLGHYALVAIQDF